MNHLHKRKNNGMYYVDMKVNGKQKRISLGTRNKVQAELRMKVKERELETVPEVSNVRIYDFLEQYKLYSAARNKETGSLKNEESIIRTFKSLVRDQNIDKFGVKSADDFFTLLGSREKPISAHGKNYYLRSLRTFWNVALSWKMVKENPFLGVEKFSIDSYPIRVLSEEEVIKIFESVHKLYPHLSELIEFYLYTGMRRNEALTLQWTEVDLERRRITILRAKQKKFRKIPMLKRVYDILKKREDRKLLRPFSDMPTGSTITHAFAAIVSDADIPHAKLHDLRKTFGTMLAEENVNPFTIVKWLGHSDKDVTLDHYIGFDDKTASRINDVGIVTSEKIRDIEERTAKEKAEEREKARSAAKAKIAARQKENHEEHAARMREYRKRKNAAPIKKRRTG